MKISVVVSFEHHEAQKGGDLSAVPQCGVVYSSSEVLGISGWLVSHVFTPLQHPTGFWGSALPDSAGTALSNKATDSVSAQLGPGNLLPSGNFFLVLI